MAAAVSSARSALQVCGVTLRMSLYRMKAGASRTRPAPAGGVTPGPAGVPKGLGRA